MARPPIPSDVRQFLRKEVRFGCPVCRKPFLEFHHFDPPYEEEAHFRPQGMVALCPECHRAAAYWTKRKCQNLKSEKNRNLAKPVKGFFDAWANDTQVLVRLGGNYTLGTDIPISIADDAVIRLSKDAETGVLQLSFDLRDRHDHPIAQMEDNGFILAPDNVDDLHVTVTKYELKLWVTPQDVGLHLTFRWLTWDQLAKRLESDWRIAGTSKTAKSILKDMTAGLPPALHANAQAELKQCSAQIHERAQQILRKKVEEKCMYDSKIPLLDVKRMVIYHRGVKTTIEDGIHAGKSAFAGNLSINNRCGFRLPAYERTATRQTPLYALSNGRATDDEPRTEFESETFIREVMVIDGKKFVKCKFESCDLIYKGGAVPAFDGCDLQSCLWVFDESARRTREWLHRICHFFGAYGNQAYQQVIEDMGKPSGKPGGRHGAEAGQASGGGPHVAALENARRAAAGGRRADGQGGDLWTEP